MKSAIVTLVIATVLGGTVASYAQEKPRAAGAPPAGMQKEMGAVGSTAAQLPEAPGPSNGPAKVGSDALVQPGAVTQAKAASKQ
jgi:hypothetical protein